MVQPFGVEPHAFLVSEATLVLGTLTLALAFVAAARTMRPERLSVALAASAGVVTLYLPSIGVVDMFAAEAYGLGYRAQDRIDELAKEAHVALSVVWTVVGVTVLGAGLFLRRANLRLAGLVTLALATAKVFLIDLASLDVAYRVVTLLVLGLVLVASAYVWTHMKPDVTRASEGEDRPLDEQPEGADSRP